MKLRKVGDDGDVPRTHVPLVDHARTLGARRLRSEKRTPAVAARLLAAVPLGLTLMPLSSTGRGWVRIWDFPRVHITALGMVAAAAMLRWARTRPADRALTAALGASLVYQIAKMVPYTPLHRPQVPDARNASKDLCLRLLIANVLQENRRSDLVLQVIGEAAPDVVCLVETDAWWARAMTPLEREYRWVTRSPLENHYGMLLYSRLPVTACDIRFLVSTDVPSMRAVVKLRSGDEVAVYAVHPPPPLPNSPTYGRDAELVLTGREIAEDGKPAIVMGDLNDVAWSYTTKLFQRLSHMVDPRVGRGMFSTFHAKHPFARYPLDHVFHTQDFTLKELRRLPYTGSDHFPILVELAFSPSRKHEVPRPAPTASDLENAEEMVQDAYRRPQRTPGKFAGGGNNPMHREPESRHTPRSSHVPPSGTPPAPNRPPPPVGSLPREPLAEVPVRAPDPG